MAKENRKHSEFNCIDCGVNTSEINEYYMLVDELWKSMLPENPHGTMLCIGCVEERIGRELVPEDFSDCYLNTIRGLVNRSMRLSDRMGLV